MYLIKFTDGGLNDVRRLGKNEKNFLKKEIRKKLETDPLGHSFGLSGDLHEYRNAHIGEYRVVFKFFDDLMAIAIVGVGKHDMDAKKDIYRRLEVIVKHGSFAERVMATLKGFTRPPTR